MPLVSGFGLHCPHTIKECHSFEFSDSNNIVIEIRTRSTRHNWKREHLCIHCSLLLITKTCPCNIHRFLKL